MALTAVAVLVIGSMLPIWPDAVRATALALSLTLAVAAILMKSRSRRAHQDWSGPQDSPSEISTDVMYEDVRFHNITRRPWQDRNSR